MPGNADTVESKVKSTHGREQVKCGLLVAVAVLRGLCLGSDPGKTFFSKE